MYRGADHDVRRLATALAAAGCCTACTVVRVDGADRVVVAAGVLRIEPGAGRRLVAVRAAGVGLVPGMAGATLGVHREEAALVFDGSDCRVIVLDAPEDPRAAAILAEAIAGRGDVCSTRELRK